MGDLATSGPTLGTEHDEPSITTTLDAHKTFDDVQPNEKGPLSTVAHGAQADPAPFANQPHGGNVSHGSQQQPLYNMVPMASALPRGGHRGGQQFSQNGQQRFVPTTSPPMMHQMDHMGQYGPSSPMGLSNHAYYGSQQPNVSQYYGGGPMPGHSHRQNMNYYQNQMLMGHSQPGYYYPQNVQYAPPNQNMQAAMFSGQYMPTSPTTANDPRVHINHHPDPRWPGQDRRGPDEQDRQQTSAVRGPPRKPRQSGHAIWVGNLPPQTELMSLVHHVCKEAPGLESLFLISKSNCAFANFKDDATCAAAQQKLHDSKFQSVRLVSRLRKSTVEGAGGATAPTGPAGSSTASTSTVPTDEDSTTAATETTQDSTGEEAQTPRPRQVVVDGGQQDKFFILKSLTVEDLERSVTTGMWATQSHNEDTLNNAFKATDNVYLVFSANKSGEYFGYARMASEINQDPDAAIEFAPKAQMTTDTDLPKAIPTEATEHAPRGRIVDDSARGTIFWEVERDEAEDDEDETQNKETDEEEEQKTWGKPFKLEWLSTNRLPFYRARGLRNPWNSSREVKIARDGTELEPAVGRKLIGYFNRFPSHTQYGQPMRAPMGMVPGYPQMRLYGA